MRIERLVPCPPEDLWRALIQNTELGKHGAMLRLALPGGLSRPRGRSVYESPRVLECAWGADVLRWELQPQGCMTRLVFTHAEMRRAMDGVPRKHRSARNACGRGRGRRVTAPHADRASARQRPAAARWAVSRRSSRPTAPRPPAATRSPSGGSSTHARARCAFHAEDDVFFVIEGTMSFLLGDEWTHAAGSFVLVPAGVTHDFENRGSARAGVLNISVPGGFEEDMPSIAQWFAENPPEQAERPPDEM